MNQRFFLRPYRGFLKRKAMDAPHSRSIIWRVGCVIGLLALVLRFYFIRELIAALSMVAFVCMTLLVLCLVCLAAYELAHVLFVLGSRCVLMATTVLQRHSGSVYFVIGKIRLTIQIAWTIVSARLLAALSGGLEQKASSTSVGEAAQRQVLQTASTSISSESISGQPGVLPVP